MKIPDRTMNFFDGYKFHLASDDNRSSQEFQFVPHSGQNDEISSSSSSSMSLDRISSSSRRSHNIFCQPIDASNNAFDSYMKCPTAKMFQTNVDQKIREKYNVSILTLSSRCMDIFGKMVNFLLLLLF